MLELIFSRKILPSHKIQQWQQLLEGPENKKGSLLREWRKETYRRSLQDEEIFRAWDEECWKVTSECSTKIDGFVQKSRRD